MIKNNKDLKHYLEQDKKALKINRSRPKFFSDEIWKYQRSL